MVQTTSSSSSLPQLAFPGLSLAPAGQYTPGPGTHIYNDQITASIAGRPITLPPGTALFPVPPSSSPSSSTYDAKGKPIIIIHRPQPSHLHAPSARISTTNTLPAIGSIVLARVLRVRSRQIDVGILCVGIPDFTSTSPSTTMQVCADEYPGVVRHEDVRATEKDQVDCSAGFRAGDVLRAQVISVGDQANYYLGTARNELGVLMARSSRDPSVLMDPVSWEHFRDPVSGQEETRKVAKPM